MSKLGWHILPYGMRLNYRDRRIVEVGKTMRVKGTPVLCMWGFHAAPTVSDALDAAVMIAYSTARFGDDWWLCRVEVSGQICNGENKFCGRQRKMLHRISARRVARILRSASSDLSRVQAAFVKNDKGDGALEKRFLRACRRHTSLKKKNKPPAKGRGDAK